MKLEQGHFYVGHTFAGHQHVLNIVIVLKLNDQKFLHVAPKAHGDRREEEIYSIEMPLV